jgi:hypothetical protein
MPLLFDEDSSDSDAKALLENTVEDGRKYSSMAAAKQSHASLHVGFSHSVSGNGIARETSLTGNATITEEVFNLIISLIN